MTDETTTTTTTTTPSQGGERSAERTAERAAPVKKVASTRKPRPRIVGVPNDPGADMLTRVRNAAGARHEAVAHPHSRTKLEIAKIRKTEGVSAGDGQPSARARGSPHE